MPKIKDMIPSNANHYKPRERKKYGTLSTKQTKNVNDKINDLIAGNKELSQYMSDHRIVFDTHRLRPEEEDDNFLLNSGDISSSGFDLDGS